MTNFKRYFPFIIIALALLGIATELITNPLAFITRLLAIVGVIAIIYFVYMNYRRKQTSSRPMFNKIKQSNHSSASTKNKPIRRQTMPRKSSPNLTVIEGKKSKKKSRALF